MKHLLCLMLVILALTAFHRFCLADDPREEKPRFKGVELYSWKDAEGEWMFALLDGTNRLKTEPEVKAAANRVQGVKALETALARLAKGEMVFWTHPVKGFEYPPEATRNAIQKAARDVDVQVVTGNEG